MKMFFFFSMDLITPVFCSKIVFELWRGQHFCQTGRCDVVCASVFAFELGSYKPPSWHGKLSFCSGLYICDCLCICSFFSWSLSLHLKLWIQLENYNAPQLAASRASQTQTFPDWPDSIIPQPQHYWQNCTTPFHHWNFGIVGIIPNHHQRPTICVSC